MDRKDYKTLSFVRHYCTAGRDIATDENHSDHVAVEDIHGTPGSRVVPGTPLSSKLSSLSASSA